MQDNKAVITRISIHEGGHPGRIHIRAKDENDLKAAIEILEKRYPQFPYMGTAGTPYRDDEGYWNVGFKHWGAD